MLVHCVTVLLIELCISPRYKLYNCWSYKLRSQTPSSCRRVIVVQSYTRPR